MWYPPTSISSASYPQSHYYYHSNYSYQQIPETENEIRYNCDSNNTEDINTIIQTDDEQPYVVDTSEMVVNDTINKSSTNCPLLHRYCSPQHFASSQHQFGTFGQSTSVLNLPQQSTIPLQKTIYHSQNSSKCVSPIHCPQQHQQKVQGAVESTTMATAKRSSTPIAHNPPFECVWNWILFSPTHYPEYYSPQQCKINDSSSTIYSNTEENDLISWLLDSDEDLSSSTDTTDAASDDESSTIDSVVRQRCASPTRSDSDDGYISSSDQGSNSLIYSSCELIKDEEILVEKLPKINPSSSSSIQDTSLHAPLKKAPLSYAATVSSSKPNTILSKIPTSPIKPPMATINDSPILRSPTSTTSLQKPKLFFVAPRFERLYQQKERTNNTSSSSTNNKIRTLNQQPTTLTTTLRSSRPLTTTTITTKRRS